MHRSRLHRQLLASAARAAYDVRPVTHLSRMEQRTWRDVQEVFRPPSGGARNLEDALALLEARRRAGVVDEAFTCSAACVLLCDTEVSDLERAEEFAARQEAAAQALSAGLRREQMLAGAQRHRGTIERRRGCPGRALDRDRAAYSLTGHPRDFANVLIDLLRCDRAHEAEQARLEESLTRGEAYAAQLEQLIADDLDLAWFHEPQGGLA